jgi:hypothetical protein
MTKPSRTRIPQQYVMIFFFFEFAGGYSERSTGQATPQFCICWLV